MTDHDTDDTNPRPSLRERLAPFGEGAVKDHVAQNIRAAWAMAGEFDIDDPRTIIDRLEAGATREELLDAFRTRPDEAQ